MAEIRGVEGTLSPMVEATHFTNQAQGFDLVHLVNTSGHFGVSFFAPVPMQELTVTVDYPRQPQSVRALVAGEACQFTWDAGRLTMTVPRLEQLEALRVE